MLKVLNDNERTIIFKMPIWRKILFFILPLSFLSIGIYLFFFISYNNETSRSFLNMILLKYFMGSLIIIGSLFLLFIFYKNIIIKKNDVLIINNQGIKLSRLPLIEWEKIVKIAKYREIIKNEKGKITGKSLYIGIILKKSKESILIKKEVALEKALDKGYSISIDDLPDYIFNQMQLPKKIDEIFNIFKQYPVMIDEKEYFV